MKKSLFPYGAVLKLTREDTAESIARQFSKMKDCGFDTVVIWPSAFWWEEKKEGYPFNTGKLVLELAEQAGIGVVMELAGQLPQMEYIPDFLMKDEYFCTDDKGLRRVSQASFGVLNYFHPEVDALICAHYAKTAEAYRHYPALVAYDVFNETMFKSFDPYTMAAFRRWLKEKYGTVERLNEVWERCYTDFEQVEYVPWTWMSVMPAADMITFRKQSIGMILKRWCDAIRAVDNTHPCWADNIGSMICNGEGVLERPQEDFLLKDAVDDIGMSFYPKQVKGTQSVDWRWCTFDSYFAASKRQGFFVAEMQTHVQAMFNPTTCVRPYELKQWCYEALAGGAKGLIYWMWRPFTKGLQTAGRGLIDYKERSTPRLEIAKDLSVFLRETGPLKPVRSEVGILFDGICQDLQSCYTKCYKLDQNIYMSSICGAYKAFMDAGVRPDIVTLAEIGQYPLLILTNHIVIGKETAAQLRSYVESGGVIVCDGKVGITDEFGTLLHTLPGGDLNAVLGHEFIDADYETLDFDFEGTQYQGYYGRELVAVTDGEVLGRFADGKPAVICKKTGKGIAMTVNTTLWYGYKTGASDADRFAAMLADRFGLRQLSATDGLMVRACESEDAVYLFVFNYTNEAKTGCVSGCGVDECLTVAAQDVVVLKREKKA